MQPNQAKPIGRWLRSMSFALLLATALPICTGNAGIAYAKDKDEQSGAVYALTNATAGNEVLVYNRSGDGSLMLAGLFATGGTGSGTGLGSQGAIIVSGIREEASADEGEDHQAEARQGDDHSQPLLFVVNAGSNSISSFRIQPDRSLAFVNTVPSGGLLPTSLAFHHGLLYVLNAGVPNNLSGFTVGQDGTLAPLADSTRPLSAQSTTPSQVSFDNRGNVVIVTERGTNQIDTYVVMGDGRLSGPAVHPSAGPAPFGFAVNKRNTLFVSEAGAGGGASAYQIGNDGSLTPTSSMLMTGQRAACWAVVTKNGRFGYVTNAGTGNISGFAINKDGTASLLNADGVTAITGGNPTDVAVSRNSRFLYARVAALNTIAVFAIAKDGSLAPLPALMGTPAGLAGLAAY